MVYKYKTMTDFSSYSAATQLVYAVVTAFPSFFSIFLFMFFLFMTGSGYFIQAKLTGQKRFWQYSTAISFICFILSLLLISMNTVDITVLEPYWTAFYILVTAFSWYQLRQYK